MPAVPHEHDFKLSKYQHAKALALGRRTLMTLRCACGYWMKIRGTVSIDGRILGTVTDVGDSNQGKKP